MRLLWLIRLRLIVYQARAAQRHADDTRKALAAFLDEAEAAHGL